MGGRGANSSSKGSSVDYEKKIVDYAPERMSYSRYKKEFPGAETVQGSYDSSAKTIEVKVGAVNTLIMQKMPDSVFQEYKSYEPGITKYEAAKYLHRELEQTIIEKMRPSKKDPSWYKDMYRVVEAERKLLTGNRGYFNRKTGRYVKYK